MTDRELIEAAAKAAGIAYEWHHGCGDSLHLTDPAASAIYWNPLVNDGQALRLAVALRLVVDTGGVSPRRKDTFVGGADGFLSVEPHDTDPAAATRRAIVRAAAAIAAANAPFPTAEEIRENWT